MYLLNLGRTLDLKSSSLKFLFLYDLHHKIYKLVGVYNAI